jgi:hypothetical protein
MLTYLFSALCIYLVFDKFDTIRIKYDKFRSINNLVSMKHKNVCMIMLVSIQLLIKMAYINFSQYIIQYINNNVKQISKNTYEITYLINGKTYKILVTPYKGPEPILQISNDKQIDITSDVLQYLGPKFDWHGNKFSPEFFNSSTLTFELCNGVEITFSNDEHIDIKI